MSSKADNLNLRHCSFIAKVHKNQGRETEIRIKQLYTEEFPPCSSSGIHGLENADIVLGGTHAATQQEFVFPEPRRQHSLYKVAEISEGHLSKPIFQPTSSNKDTTKTIQGTLNPTDQAWSHRKDSGHGWLLHAKFPKGLDWTNQLLTYKVTLFWQ